MHYICQIETINGITDTLEVEKDGAAVDLTTLGRFHPRYLGDDQKVIEEAARHNNLSLD